MKSIYTYYTDGKPALPAGQNAGRAKAIAYAEGKTKIMSFPPRLNHGKIPSLTDAAAILAGAGIALGPVVMPKVDLTKRPQELFGVIVPPVLVPGNYNAQPVPGGYAIFNGANRAGGYSTLPTLDEACRIVYQLNGITTRSNNQIMMDVCTSLKIKRLAAEAAAQ